MVRSRLHTTEYPLTPPMPTRSYGCLYWSASNYVIVYNSIEKPSVNRGSFKDLEIVCSYLGFQTIGHSLQV